MGAAVDNDDVHGSSSRNGGWRFGVVDGFIIDGGLTATADEH